MSDKLAALEVVRHRLNQANLGHFCLELHSHKTQKKKLLTDLQERITQTFRPPQQLNENISTLKRHRYDLNRYAEIMASCVGNEIGLTVHEVFWRTELYRQALGESANVVESLLLLDAVGWTYDDVAVRRDKLEVLAQHYASIGSFDATHPWWGFVPRLLAPGDDEAIRRILSLAMSVAERLVDSISGYRQQTLYDEEPSLQNLSDLYDALRQLPQPSASLIEDLLPRLITPEDTSGKRTIESLKSVIHHIDQAKSLKSKAESVLLPGYDLDPSSSKLTLAAYMGELNPHLLSKPLCEFEELVSEAEEAIQQFEYLVSNQSSVCVN